MEVDRVVILGVACISLLFALMTGTALYAVISGQTSGFATVAALAIVVVTAVVQIFVWSIPKI